MIKYFGIELLEYKIMSKNTEFKIRLIINIFKQNNCLAC